MSVHDADYRKVKKVLGIPEDEPIFILRAQDNLSRPAIARYRNLRATVESAPPTDEWLRNMDDVDQEFVKWQQENSAKVKLAD